MITVAVINESVILATSSPVNFTDAHKSFLHAWN